MTTIAFCTVNITERVREAISGYFVVSARNCLAFTLNYIAMRVSKANREKAIHTKTTTTTQQQQSTPSTTATTTTKTETKRATTTKTVTITPTETIIKTTAKTTATTTSKTATIAATTISTITDKTVDNDNTIVKSKDKKSAG